MPYTIKNARPVLLSYLGLSEQTANFIAGTDKWGILFERESLKCVIFIMPLGENTSSPKVYFDIRDSGAEKFVAAWNFALQNNLKFFCLGVKDENQKYKEHIISVEADINTVLKVSGLENGRRSGSGTQLNIPADLIPIGNITRGKSNKFDIFFSVIKKEYLFTYLEVFDNRLFQFIKAKENNIPDDLNNDSNLLLTLPSQTIFYGVPGSGKSHKIDEETKDLPDEQKMRVVFHPEYTNADFVGQILPSNADGTISYKFKPGPFTKILRRAYLNPSKKYCLIIEEINRGNAAAIFGDVFQLLDRITAGKGEASGGYSYGNGWSRYSIENEFMNWYIRENLYADTNHKLQNEDDGIATKSADESQKAIEIGELHFSALTGIRLPPNLSLYATMNTSDQNVFTLDNAYQRRWDMKLVENKFEGKDAEKQRNAKIGGTEVTWENFQTFINKKISESSSSVGMSSMEDKRLGCWFVKETDGKISKEKFAEKVLKYLWDDAFKFNHDDIFNIQENASFESIVEKFKGKENESCDWSIFKDTSFVQSANEQ